MTCEEYIISYLATELADPDVSVSGSVPHPMPDEFVTVEMVGHGRANYIDTVLLSIESWSTSRAAAAALHERVAAAMAGSVTAAEISSCELETAYNDTDMASHRPRYHARFAIVYLES